MTKKLFARILFLSLGISFSAGATPTGHLAVVNKADHSVSFFSLLGSDYPTMTIKLGYLPHEVASSHDGTKVYVTNYGKDHVRSTSPNNKPGNTVTVIDLFGAIPAYDIQLGEIPCAPHGVASSKDDQRLYVTCEDRQEIVVVNMTTKQIQSTIPTGQQQSHMLVITDDESLAFTTNFSAGTVTVMDLKAKKILKIIQIGPGPEGISLSPDNKYLYVTSVLGNKLIKISTSTLLIEQSTNTDKSPIRVLPTPNGKYLLVNNSAENTLQVYDAETLDFVQRIAVGRQPIGLSIANNQFVLVANMNDNTVSMINLERFQIEREFKTGNKPDGILFIPSPSQH